MNNMSSQERRLVQAFLEAYKKLIELSGIPFNPRSLTVVSQPNLKNPKEFHWISYNKWLDELEVDASVGKADSIIATFLDIPIQVLISAENIGKCLLSKKDKKKLMKALKLLTEIKVENQNEKS